MFGHLGGSFIHSFGATLRVARERSIDRHSLVSLANDASTSRLDGGAKNDGTRDHDLVDVARGHGTGGGTDDGARGRGAHEKR